MHAIRVLSGTRIETTRGALSSQLRRAPGRRWIFSPGRIVRVGAEHGRGRGDGSFRDDGGPSHGPRCTRLENCQWECALVPSNEPPPKTQRSAALPRARRSAIIGSSSAASRAVSMAVQYARPMFVPDQYSVRSASARGAPEHFAVLFGIGVGLSTWVRSWGSDARGDGRSSFEVWNCTSVPNQELSRPGHSLASSCDIQASRA